MLKELILINEVQILCVLCLIYNINQSTQVELQIIFITEFCIIQR